jgi:hypothetical protein
MFEQMWEIVNDLTGADIDRKALFRNVVVIM